LGKQLGVKIPLVATSRDTNAKALVYTAHTVQIFTCAPITFLLVDQSSPNFFRPTQKEL